MYIILAYAFSTEGLIPLPQSLVFVIFVYYMYPVTC